VVNATPTVSIGAPATGSTFEHGAPITFTGTATDREDGTLTGSIAWSSDRDGLLGTGFSVTTGTLSSGTHTITASATDSGGKTGRAAITVVVNSTPAVSISSPAASATFDPGAPVTLSAAASDLEDGSLTAAIVWTSSRDGGLGTGGTITTSALSTGTHVLTASATDRGGKTGRATVTITINTTPAVTVTAPANNATYELGAAVTLSGTATDVEDGTLTANITWISSRDGSLGTGSTITRSTLTSGTHVITAAATDSGGKTGRASITITVNNTPAAMITAPATGATFEPGAGVTFTASASDTEDGEPRRGARHRHHDHGEHALDRHPHDHRRRHRERQQDGPGDDHHRRQRHPDGRDHRARDGGQLRARGHGGLHRDGHRRRGWEPRLGGHLDLEPGRPPRHGPERHGEHAVGRHAHHRRLGH